MTNEEKTNIRNIMKDYGRCYKDIELLEKQIEELDEKRARIIKELHSIRDREAKIVSELKEKYGEDASLDLETLEINGKD